MKGFVLMLTFLTRLPFPVTYEFREEDFVKGRFFFPLIGGIIGGLLLPVLFIFQRFPQSYLNVALIVAYLMITGGLHLDGVADVWDGLFSFRKRERVLEIMSDSRIGTFGVIGLILYFLMLWVGLSETTWEGVLLFPVVGRCIGLILCGLFPYAKVQGMGKQMIQGTHLNHALLMGLIGTGITLLFGGEYLLAYGLTLIIMSGIVARINLRLEGITGDVIGLSIELSQCFFLLLLGGIKYL